MCCLTAVVAAVEVTLDEVIAESRRGPVTLRVENRASFDFDPDSGVLTSAGIWVAQNTVGPNELTRYSHKVENFRAALETGHAFRSYECVEGTFGTMLLASVCGNYRYGPNMTDDGGLIDDIAITTAKSLDDYTLSLLTWDGSTLIVVLSSKDPTRQEIYPEFSLTLTFSANMAERPESPPESPRRPEDPVEAAR